MEITPMLIFIWKIFIVAKLCQFCYNVKIMEPSIWTLLTDIVEVIIIVSMILFGFELLTDILTWSELGGFRYILLIFVWTIECVLTHTLNTGITTKI